MATIPAVQLNAIERKNLLKAAEHLYKATHFSQKEVECLLYIYRGLTQDRIDRVTFRDLLHDHFAMSDDFFMDRGKKERHSHPMLVSQVMDCQLGPRLRTSLTQSIAQIEPFQICLRCVCVITVSIIRFH